MTLNELKQQAAELYVSKGWSRKDSKKPRTAKNLAISLILEASEVLECFQWADEPLNNVVDSELADVLIYVAHIANALGIDLEKAVTEKIQKNISRSWEA
jgi:dCTP diphosphatase